MKLLDFLTLSQLLLPVKVLKTEMKSNDIYLSSVAVLAMACNGQNMGISQIIKIQKWWIWFKVVSDMREMGIIHISVIYEDCF